MEEPAPIICVDFKTEADCNLAVETNSGKFCIWIVSSNECKGAVASKCSAVNNVDKTNIEHLCGRLKDLCFYVLKINQYINRILMKELVNS